MWTSTDQGIHGVLLGEEGVREEEGREGGERRGERKEGGEGGREGGRERGREGEMMAAGCKFCSYTDGMKAIGQKILTRSVG